MFRLGIIKAVSIMMLTPLFISLSTSTPHRSKSITAGNYYDNQQNNVVEINKESMGHSEGDGEASDNIMLSMAMKLMRTIFSDYAKEIMPQRPVIVSLDVVLFKIKATIEKEGIFECVVDLVIEWCDRRMSWNPSDFGNITILALDANTVWIPDIGMSNSADHPYQITRDMRFIVRTNYKGEMRIVPSGTARTWCTLLLSYFPFDVQTCSLEFESWSLDTATMTFDGRSRLIIDSHFDSNQFFFCSYEAITYIHAYEFYNETFTRVRFDMTVKRKSTFQVVNLIFPCAVLSCIQLLVFFLPSVQTTADRIALATTNMLTLVVFQTFFAEQLPRTSNAVTALSKYTTALILIAAFGIIESVFVERLHDMRRTPPPRRLIWFLKRVPPILREKSDSEAFAAFLGDEDEKSTVTPAGSNSKAVVNKAKPSLKKLAEILTRNQNRNAKLWREIAFRIDFLSFSVCFLLVVFLPCSLFLPAILQQPACGNIEERFESHQHE